tara:strand:+ start:521 stop:667 length:147 start_codon:yes stop_codon:yes gene_type:complete
MTISTVHNFKGMFLKSVALIAVTSDLQRKIVLATSEIMTDSFILDVGK